MYYTSQDKETLEAYNERIVEAQGYDGSTTVRWASIIEHQDGDKWAMLKHPSYPLIEGVDDDGEPLDAPTVDSIADFYPPIEE
jgi:hypothetical protein